MKKASEPRAKPIFFARGLLSESKLSSKGAKREQCSLGTERKVLCLWLTLLIVSAEAAKKREKLGCNNAFGVL